MKTPLKLKVLITLRTMVVILDFSVPCVSVPLCETSTATFRIKYVELHHEQVKRESLGFLNRS